MHLPTSTSRVDELAAAPSVGLVERAEAFRLEVRAWLDHNRPSPRQPHVDLERAIFGNVVGLDEWVAQVHDAGYLCITWPEEFGGRGLSLMEAMALNEEFARAGVYRPTRGLGETLVGPSILAWGTTEQKARFLPRIVNGTERYCQGFSEPDAGSDLAGLSTSGTVDGDEIVVTGQKVWTSCAAGANMLFCLCRTDADASARHRGISFVILPFERPDGSANGIELRPVRQLTGSAEFAETFLAGARAPLTYIIGGLNNGWQVAMTTFANERGGSTVSHHLPFVAQFWDAVELVRRRGLAADSRVRQELARSYIETELIRYRGLQQLAEVLDGREPGPIASTGKIAWSEHARHFSQVIVNLRGAAGLLASDAEADGAAYKPDEMTANFLFAPGFTIAGGTNEVLRNVVAERVLGLPREPQGASDSQT